MCVILKHTHTHTQTQTLSFSVSIHERDMVDPDGLLGWPAPISLSSPAPQFPSGVFFSLNTAQWSCHRGPCSQARTTWYACLACDSWEGPGGGQQVPARALAPWSCSPVPRIPISGTSEAILVLSRLQVSFSSLLLFLEASWHPFKEHPLVGN